MARFSRRKQMVELFKRVPNWTAAVIAPFLLCLKLWKKANKQSTMHHALLHVTHTTDRDSIGRFAALVAHTNEQTHAHIVQQLRYYTRKVTGQQHLAFGYAAQPKPLAEEEALQYLANTLRGLRRRSQLKPRRAAADAPRAELGCSSSTMRPQNGNNVHGTLCGPQPGAVGTFPLTIDGQLPPAPIFATSHAWKARAHQGFSDGSSLGLSTHSTHTGVFQRWLLPWPSVPDLSAANRKRMAEAVAWGLAAMLADGEIVAVRWGALREAQQREARGGHQLSVQELARYIWRQRLPTLGTSRSNHIILARLGGGGRVETRRALSAELISAMGVPLGHSVRHGLSAITENQAVSLVGQAVDVGCAAAACGYGLQRARLLDPTEAVTYGAAACGLDLVAVALLGLRPNMKYAFAVEALSIPTTAHRRGWAGQPVTYFTLAHDPTQVSLMPKVQVWAWTGRCNPYTRWSRRSPREKAEAKQRAAEEMNAAFEYVRTHRPSVVVGENVAAFGRGGEGRVWRTFLAILHSAGPYDWSWQVVQPVEVDSDAAMNRSRFWYVGVLRSS